MIWVFRWSVGAQLCYCHPFMAVVIILGLKFIHINLYRLQRFWFKSHLPCLISFWESAVSPQTLPGSCGPGAARAPTQSHLVSAHCPPGHCSLKDSCPKQMVTSVIWAINCYNIWQLAFLWELTFGFFGPSILRSMDQSRKLNRSKHFIFFLNMRFKWLAVTWNNKIKNSKKIINLLQWENPFDKFLLLILFLPWVATLLQPQQL